MTPYSIQSMSMSPCVHEPRLSFESLDSDLDLDIAVGIQRLVSFDSLCSPFTLSFQSMIAIVIVILYFIGLLLCTWNLALSTLATANCQLGSLVRGRPGTGFLGPLLLIAIYHLHKPSYCKHHSVYLTGPDLIPVLFTVLKKSWLQTCRKHAQLINSAPHHCEEP